MSKSHMSYLKFELVKYQTFTFYLIGFADKYYMIEQNLSLYCNIISSITPILPRL